MAASLGCIFSAAAAAAAARLGKVNKAVVYG